LGTWHAPLRADLRTANPFIGEGAERDKSKPRVSTGVLAAVATPRR